MIRRFAAAILVLVAVAAGGCSSSSSDPAEMQEKFGVRMAKMNLWREAMFRFQRAVELNPDDAMAHNNLAVAYEANGDFEAAAKAYREAMRLDRSNQYIQKNYSRFVEFTTRDRRRQQQQKRPAAQTAAAQAAAQQEGEIAAGTTQPAGEPGEAENAPKPEQPATAPAEPPASPPPAPPQTSTNPPGGSS